MTYRINSTQKAMCVYKLLPGMQRPSADGSDEEPVVPTEFAPGQAYILKDFDGDDFQRYRQDNASALSNVSASFYRRGPYFVLEIE